MSNSSHLVEFNKLLGICLGFQNLPLLFINSISSIVIFVIQVEVSCGQFSCNQIPAIEWKLGGSFFSYATGEHRTGSQASIIRKTFQGWIDVQETSMAVLMSSFCKQSFIKAGSVSTRGTNFLRLVSKSGYCHLEFHCRSIWVRLMASV